MTDPANSALNSIVTIALGAFTGALLSITFQLFRQHRAKLRAEIERRSQVQMVKPQPSNAGHPDTTTSGTPDASILQNIDLRVRKA